MRREGERGREGTGRGQTQGEERGGERERGYWQ